MRPRVLVVDIGGSNIKISGTGRKGFMKIPSGPDMNARRMVALVKEATENWRYDVVSIGYPGPVANSRPARDPINLGKGWVRFDYRKAFGKPVKVMNDAAMQALGSYEGGKMLFLGLGTGLGSALVTEPGKVVPLELGHLPYHSGGTYEDYAGLRGFKRMGVERWTKHVHIIIALLKDGMQAEYVMLGGGQTKKLKRLPPDVRLGNNLQAIRGGLRLWDEPRPRPGRRVARRALRVLSRTLPRSASASA